MNTDTLKRKLEAEQARLELELTDIGYMNPSNPNDWLAGVRKNSNPETADLSNVADMDEEQGTNTAIINELEVRLNEVYAALTRLADGTYGVCHICNKAISAERLEANPAAQTCIACA